MLEALIPVVGSIITKFLPDNSPETEQKRIELQTAIVTAVAAQYSKQAETNMAEANNPSVFVSGWRPFIGWVCGFAFAYVCIMCPLINWALLMHHVVTLPSIDPSTFNSILMGMLGLGGLRSFEKFKGVSK